MSLPVIKYEALIVSTPFTCGNAHAMATPQRDAKLFEESEARARRVGATTEVDTRLQTFSTSSEVATVFGLTVT